MKMRVVSMILILFLLVVMLTGCCVEDADAGKDNPFRGRLEVYDIDHDTSVIVDKHTGVSYLWKCSYKYGAGLVVMVDEYGCPLTYWEDGWDD